MPTAPDHCSVADGPVWDFQPLHGEVLRVGRGQHGPVRSRGRCDEAVRLLEYDSARGIRPTPVTGPPTRRQCAGMAEAPHRAPSRAPAIAATLSVSCAMPIAVEKAGSERTASPCTSAVVHEAVLGERMHKDNFNRRVKDLVDPVLDAEGGRSCPMAFAAGLRRSIARGARRYSRKKHDSLSMGGPACQLGECGDYPWLGRRSPGGCRRARRSGSLQLAPAPGAQRTPDSRMLRVRNSVFSRSWVSAGSTC
jgi:hypothetical protein